MTDTSTIDLNASKCITEQTFIGHQQYTNICSGVVHDVPWGTGDWLANICLALVMVFIVAALIGMISGGAYMIWKDSK